MGQNRGVLRKRETRRVSGALHWETLDTYNLDRGVGPLSCQSSRGAGPF
jgi:hypothetical protein